MKNRMLTASLLLLCAFAHAPTQSATGSPQPAQASAPQEAPKAGAAQTQRPGAGRYEELLQRLKKGDRTVDLGELRMAYAESKDYSPYGGDREARGAMFAALRAGDWEAALKQSAKILDKNYVDINAHFGAHVANARKGDAEKAAFHKFVLDGLVKSVRGSGDGKSMETAFVVISTDEEYALLNLMGLRPAGQSLMAGGGHRYDMLEAVDPKTNEQQKFYFQIDKPYGWLGNSLKKD
ncbi:MAG TPA: DUF4919 domain-containing protein [Pyrinomonadaceae bacterium]|jgi:hypothetical protein